MITKSNLALFSSYLDDHKEILIGFDKESIYLFIMDQILSDVIYENWKDIKVASEELTEFMEKVYPLISDKTEDLG